MKKRWEIKHNLHLAAGYYKAMCLKMTIVDARETKRQLTTQWSLYLNMIEKAPCGDTYLQSQPKEAEKLGHDLHGYAVSPNPS